MKNIRLLELILRDFQGGNFTLTTNGEDVSVLGDNGVGKTRLASAFSYLLLGKDSLGRSDFAIKNINAQGEAEHNLEHTVSATLEVDNEKITLKKVFSEIWSRKRGAPKSSFSGHSTQHYVNGVPKSEREYKDIISELSGDEAIFRLLTSPTVFPNLPAEKGMPGWQRQRALLLTVCGDLTDAEVIATDSKLALLPTILGTRKLDDHKKVIAARRAEINKEMDKLPVRMDEVRRGLPDVTGLDRMAIAADIKALETEVSDWQLKLQGVDTGGAIAGMTKKMAEIDTDLQKMRSAHYSTTMATVNGLTLRYNDVSNLIYRNERRIAEINSDLKTKESRLIAIEADRTALLTKWNAVDAEVFQDSTNDTCAACGQALPSVRVEAAQEKALAAFNTSKAERMDDIEKRGRRVKEDIERLQSDITALKKDRDNNEFSLPEARMKLEAVDSARKTVMKLAEDYASILGYPGMLSQKSEIEAQIQRERDGHATDAVMVREAISVAQNKLTANKECSDRFVRREQGEQRIEVLKDEEKTLAAEFEKLEAELFLCESFTRTRVRLLTDKINSRFEIVRFKMFNELVNGGLEECCEITVNGVPYNSGLNNAARIQAGMDVIRTLQRHYGMSVPVIIDNRESVTTLPAMECQLISLVVSAADKTMRVETSAREMVAA
jgi:hypothetical protein